MKYTYLFIVMILVASCSFAGRKHHTNNNAATDSIITKKSYQNDNDKVSEYLKRRDYYIEHFKKVQDTENEDSLYYSDNKALKDLEKRLREILKDSQYSRQGKINLETLINEVGFGMLDGLTFEKDSMIIVYTTKQLFFDYFKKLKISQLSDLKPKDLGTIFTDAFASDAGITNFSYFKISSDNTVQTYGMVGLVAQDIGPFLPDYLYVLVAKDNYIYMAEKPLKQSVKPIPECKAVWDSIDRESQKSYEIYQNSNLTDSAAFNRHVHLEDVAWNKYCDCYQKKFKNDSQFTAIQSQIVKMAGYLEK